MQIRLVSKKFLGDKTPKEVQDRILDILLVWTDKFPELGKIKEAYTMLRTQGVVHEPQRNVIKPVSKKSVDPAAKLLESDKLKRLLQSRNQRDIEAANLMIQNMVRDNDRRISNQNRRLIDLQSAHENAILLKEMLEEFNTSDFNQDILSTLSDIFNNCVKLKPTVLRLAEETHESEAFTAKIFETKELLDQVIDSYATIIMKGNPTVKPSKSVKTKNENDKVNMMKELDEIFSTSPTSSAPPPSSSKIDDLLAPSHEQKVASNDEIIELIKSYKTTNANNLIGNFDMPAQQSSVSPSKVDKKSPEAKLSELDSLVTGIMKSTLTGNNALDKNGDDCTQSLNDSDDDNNLIIETNDETQKVESSAAIVCDTKEPPKLALKEINLSIDDIEPSDEEPPRTIMDEKNGLKVLVNFTKNSPAKDVCVIVITVVNQGSVAIENIQFDASVSKPCKLRILDASGVSLPGVKPFKPPTETINQVLLLMNPTHENVNMIAIITYNFEGDDDPYKESFEVKSIPFMS